MNKQKQLWFSVDNNTTAGVLDKVFNLSYSTLCLRPDQVDVLQQVTLPQRMSLAFMCQNAGDLEAIERNQSIAEKTEYVLTKDVSLLDTIRTTKRKAGLFINVDDRRSLDLAVDSAPKTDVMLIEFKDPTNIPLELVLATTQSSDTRILKKVVSAEDGAVSFLTMEKGSDGIVLNSNDVQEISTLDQAFQKATTGKFDLQEAIVTKIVHSGMGDRVCIDTTSELFTDEGMLLGSTSTGGLMVCSETHYLPYMNLRPFRVNAGALHSYVWGPDNIVAYLSDLTAGSKLHVVNARGVARTVTVGRLKIERRPLLNIHAAVGEHPINVFIQDDWHVRMFGSKGEIRPSSEIRPGDGLLAYVDSPGRHVGIKINETIREV